MMEYGLIMILVVIAVAGVLYSLSNDGITPKFEGLQTQVEGVSVPNIN